MPESADGAGADNFDGRYDAGTRPAAVRRLLPGGRAGPPERTAASGGRLFTGWIDDRSARGRRRGGDHAGGRGRAAARRGAGGRLRAERGPGGLPGRAGRGGVSGGVDRLRGRGRDAGTRRLALAAGADDDLGGRARRGADLAWTLLGRAVGRAELPGAGVAARGVRGARAGGRRVRRGAGRRSRRARHGARRGAGDQRGAGRHVPGRASRRRRGAVGIERRAAAGARRDADVAGAVPRRAGRALRRGRGGRAGPAGGLSCERVTRRERGRLHDRPGVRSGGHGRGDAPRLAFYGHATGRLYVHFSAARKPVLAQGRWITSGGRGQQASYQNGGS